MSNKKRWLWLLGFTLFAIGSCYAQSTLSVIVKDAESGELLPGTTATLQGTTLGGSANEQGFIIIENIPDGNHVIVFSFVGYQEKTLSLNFPLESTRTVQVSLVADEEELDEVVITSTRSSRTIADIPTRVEFIAGEELEEKANMKPGDIRMLLSESTGIQTQQTSPTSANASIRIQGLDGRYTQILKDGFPLFAGFSGGLGLLQTPPLDLKQVEVIKGSSSTLYGGGAIAGLVNLISKTPDEERTLQFLVNGTSAKGLDLSGFYGQKYSKVGVTMFATRNSSEPYDPADIGLTAIPKFERYSINPKLFFDISERTKMNVGFNFTTEDRIGGDIKFIEGNGDATHSFFEDNESLRYSTQLSFNSQLSDAISLTIKNSFNHFDRNIKVPGYTFEGTQNSTFTEVSLTRLKEQSEWIGGLNLWTDKFVEEQFSITPLRNYDQTTFGAFIQNNFKISENLHIESGIRGDHVIDYGFVFLPRLSLLYKVNERLSSRIGGGFGYKAPTIFTEESERIQFENVLPVSADKNKLEKSYGANWDINYRFSLGHIGVNINHLFFYTYLDDPLMLAPLQDTFYELINIEGHTDSKGTETNLKAEWNDFTLFIGYTFTDTRIHNEGSSVQNPLTPRHRLNNVLMYEVEEKWKVGLEAYYFSKQRLTDNTYGKDYWICGFMAEKIWEHFSLYINFENFLDARQTRFDTIYSGSISNPVFRDIYAPVDGFVVNGGIKVSL